LGQRIGEGPIGSNPDHNLDSGSNSDPDHRITVLLCPWRRYALNRAPF